MKKLKVKDLPNGHSENKMQNTNKKASVSFTAKDIFRITDAQKDVTISRKKILFKCYVQILRN
jgi:hypothetical protein